VDVPVSDGNKIENLPEGFAKDGGSVSTQNGAPFPFPNYFDNQRGWASPEWMESYIAAAAITRLIQSNKNPQVIVGDVVALTIERANDFGLDMKPEHALNIVEGLRLRGIISAGDNSSSLQMNSSISVTKSMRYMSVWADDYTAIKRDIEESLEKGDEDILSVIREYSQEVIQWDMYPVEAQYPVLRAVSLLDADLQLKLVNILSENNKKLHTTLANAIILMLDYDKGKFNWFDQWAPDLHGRSLYMVAAEVTVLAGGLGRVMQYHGAAVKELGADVSYIEPYYTKMRDKGGNIVDTVYTALPIPLKASPLKDSTLKDAATENLPMIDHEFSTIVGGRNVPFHVYTGVNPEGVRSFLIKDDTGDYVKLLYEYDQDMNSLGSNQMFTQFFSKASAEVIRYLEIEKRAIKLKAKEEYRAPLIDANDGQSLPLLAWIRMFYSNKSLINPIGVSRKNIEATYDIFSNAILSGTTHTYRNRSIIEDQWAGLQFLRAAGVRDEWLWLFMRKEGNGPVFFDLTSGGLRAADVAKGVSAIHAYEMAPRDPGIKLLGVTNGDNRLYSSKFFREALKEAGNTDYEHATPEKVAEAKKISKRRIDLNDSQTVISYIGRLVPEKAGRNGAFTDKNIEAAVKEGVQVVIYGNVQQNDASRTIAERLDFLQKRLDTAGYAGKFIFKSRFNIDEQRMLLAASDMQIQDSDRHTGASEYTESNASANGALQMGAAYWEGIIQHQGGVINRRSETGNTIIPQSTRPEDYLSAILWVNEQFKNSKLSLYQAQSIRFSRILEARITGASFLTVWNDAAGKKVLGSVRPRISGDIDEDHSIQNIRNMHDVVMSVNLPGGSIALNKTYGNTFCLKDLPASARENLEMSIYVNLKPLSPFSSGDHDRGIILAEYVKAKIVNQYGMVIPMKLKSFDSDYALMSAVIPADFPLPMISNIVVSSGLWQLSLPVRIFATDPQNGQQAMDGGSKQVIGSEGKVGGIDFRAIPVSSYIVRRLAQKKLDANQELELNSQWQGIENSIQTGNVPYEKIKAYILQCSGSSDANVKLTAVADCMQDVLETEEASALSSNPQMKEILAYLG